MPLKKTHGGKRKGAGRPKLDNARTLKLAVVVDPVMKDRVVAVAEECGKTVSDVIYEALERAYGKG